MALDLQLANPIDTTSQQISDQNGNASALALSTNNVALNDNTFSLRAAVDPYHIIAYTPANDTDYWIFNTQLVFQQGPSTAPITLMVLSCTGTVAFPKMPSSSSAPSGANLQNVQVDVNTGILYYD